ncbi:ATP-binding cassette domain-containing protein [Dysgonomonas hofstadii]|uniref:ATP-binding cassette domain-containing protein n=1 Tax=Dysgonomonas hofstadii TaxID=637886 RepID=UPI00160E70BB|nr:ATP-binding cassette domain-containing protein [Dysgonomonas hofstadii]
MVEKTIINIKEAIPRLELYRFSEPVNWEIREGQYWAVIGPNGGGKTLLTDLLSGKLALKKGEIEPGNNERISSTVKSVAFRDIYSIVDTQNSYYQQRWNKGVELDVPFVSDLVANTDRQWLDMLIDWFEISDLMNKKVDMLSSGELRKFLIVKILLSKPKILVLDNPFIGLDFKSRQILSDLLARLKKLEGLQIVLVLSNPKDIQDVVTDILPVADKKIYPQISKDDFLENRLFIKELFKEDDKVAGISNLEPLVEKDIIPFQNAAILKDIHIKYGERTILKDLNWTVERGEKWALLGVNGSGKSTLLSLICGDNPQAYANNITLFDRKRGTGESIWDIKKRIGYISPEMHLYYLKNVRCIDVVGSGFFDTIGLYRKCNADQEQLALHWMKIFGVEHLQDISFLNVSSGEQRLILLARVFVKNPDLLILDEPLHGLDFVNKRKVKRIIEEFCNTEKSLIYVTHYEEEIPDVVNKRLILEKIKG